MAQIVATEAAEHNAVRPEEARFADFRGARPARRAIGGRSFGRARPPHRHANCDRNRREAARRSDDRALDKDRGRIGIEPIPPEKERRWRIDRHARDLCPCCPELGLVAKPPGRPLCRTPDGGEHDHRHDEDLTPGEFWWRTSAAPISARRALLITRRRGSKGKPDGVALYRAVARNYRMGSGSKPALAPKAPIDHAARPHRSEHLPAKLALQ